MRRTLALFAVLLLCGCPHRRLDFGPKGRIEDPSALLALVDEAEAKVLSLDGEAKLKLTSPEQKGSASLFVSILRPGFVHLEVLDFFGRPQAVLVADAKTFGLYNAQEGKYYQGPSTAENVARFLPLALPPTELVPMMLGAPPRIVADRTSLDVDPARYAYRLVLTRGVVTQTLWVDPKLYRVLRSEIRGVAAYDVTYDDLTTVGAAVYPRYVKVDVAQAGTTVEVRYSDVSLNKSPDMTLFEQTPPEDVPVVQVGESGVGAEGQVPQIQLGPETPTPDAGSSDVAADGGR